MLPASLPVRAATHAAGDTGLMFFLLRMAFWLSVVLILLPSGSAQRVQPPPSEVGASEAISAASATVADVRGFCARQPDACSVGAQVAVSLGYRAQAGAKMLYEFLTEALATREIGPLARTGSITKTAQDRSAPDRASQNTLLPADLAPVWRGPQVRRDPKHSA
jgi:hypothetical protein